MNSRTVVFVRGRPVKINKLQAGAVTEKVIQQLNAEPKVIISVNSALRASLSKSDRNVPDLSHVVYNEECSTALEDTSVYENVSEKRKGVDDSTINDIESELDKMFCMDTELSTIHNEPSKAHHVTNSNKPRSKSRKVQKQDLNELLIKLFGSPLEDIEVKKSQPKKIQSSRRHTLPVSINIPQKFLNPLKVSQKRKSANDAISSTLCKSQKKESVSTACALPHTELAIAELLIKEETITQRVHAVVTGALVSATVMEKPTTGEAETVKCGLVIDLTGEDGDNSDRYELVIDTSSEEVKKEPSTSSESANAPTKAQSMPLLSPVSPAQPTQREATLPETCSSSQRPPPHIPVMIVPKPPAALPPVSRPQPPTKRTYPDSVQENQQVQEAETMRSKLSTVRLPAKRPYLQGTWHPPLDAPASRNAVPPATGLLTDRPNEESAAQPAAVPPVNQQAPPLLTHSYFSNLRTLQADKTSQQAPNQRQTISNIPQSSSRIATHQSQSRPNGQLQATVSSIQQTAQHQVVPQPPQMSYRPQMFAPPLQRQNSAPPLIRMLRPLHAQYEFHLISNAACGVKLLPHVLTMARWKASAIRFCEEVQTYLIPGDFKQDYGAFCVYTNQSLINFGKKLIRDLLSVEVENFDVGEVCTVISRKLHEKNCSATNYRVCFNIHAMIKSCEEFCMTPFTKKFFHDVKTCVEKMEEKTQKGQQGQQASITVSQLKQLELQIQQYIHVQRWLDFAYTSSSRPQARPHHRPTKKTQKKATDPNPLKQNLQHTMLKTMLQHQNVPDRSGRSNDNSTRPDLIPVIADKQVPSQQTPGIGSVEQSQPHPVPVRLQLPQPPNVPAEVPAIVRQSPSREASVIVFTPIEEAPPVENRTEAISTTSKSEQNGLDEGIIDLTWIDDGDEDVMLEEITESKAFPCKLENYPESETEAREAVSPADSGLGSPHSQMDESFKCLCGKQAIYVCACKISMYCGRECQMNDWSDHQRWCQENSSSS